MKRNSGLQRQRILVKKGKAAVREDRFQAHLKFKLQTGNPTTNKADWHW